MVQVIDKAVIPEKKSWPPRLLIIATSCILAALASGLWIVVSSKAASQTGSIG
jgi:uncharacterized protein involved in exopolysaccharide biosynthesis